MPPKRRASDALRAVDGIVHSHLQHAPIEARILSNLAMTMLLEYSGAARATLLLREGAELAAAFAIGPGLKAAAPDIASYDPELVTEAESQGKLVARGRALAAPVMLGGRVQGVIYIEGGALGLVAEAQELAQGVATRIATLLHSATLVEDAARRAANVEALEALGACLSAGTLTDEHLDRSLAAAREATASDEAMLGLMSEDGELLDLHVRGGDEKELRAVGLGIAARMRRNEREESSRLLGEPGLLEALGGELLIASDPSFPRMPLGFLAVRRRSGSAYSDAERTVFRALAHLLAGALARLSYYRKASQDALTGTGSRLALELAIVEAMEEARTTEAPLSVLLVDVDRFKQVNDEHGHLTGDSILKSVAEALRARLRVRDFVARFGGDEFIVLLPETGHAEAGRVADELRLRMLARTHDKEGLRVTLSIGVAAYPVHATTPHDLVRRADEALYLSKAAGRNRVTVASSS